MLVRNVFWKGEQLQNIVDKINIGYKLDYSNNSLYLDSQYVNGICYCPGVLCKHSKMNVIKLNEHLNNFNNYRIIINACKAQCLKMQCDLEIICTLDGCIFENKTLDEKKVNEIKESIK